MTKAIRIHKTGGAEVLQWEDVEVGKVGAGQARIRRTAVGLNFIDTYQRSGLYPLPLPSGVGLEAAIVEEVGEGVSHVRWATASPAQAVRRAPMRKNALCRPPRWSDRRRKSPISRPRPCCFKASPPNISCHGPISPSQVRPSFTRPRTASGLSSANG
jgi:hypothetical protein